MSTTRPHQSTPNAKLKLRSDGPQAWLLADAVTAAVVGGIRYEHGQDGNHYRAWVLVDGAQHDFGEPMPQLKMAARAIEDEMARAGCPKP